MGVRFAECCRRQPSADKADDRGGEDNQRKGNVQRKNSDKGSSGDSPVGAIFQRPRANAVRACSTIAATAGLMP